jgi:hypothetical protein
MAAFFAEVRWIFGVEAGFLILYISNIYIHIHGYPKRAGGDDAPPAECGFKALTY